MCLLGTVRESTYEFYERNVFCWNLTLRHEHKLFFFCLDPISRRSRTDSAGKHDSYSIVRMSLVVRQYIPPTQWSKRLFCKKL